jgi:UDP-glucose 6-dehydrogenase
MKIGVIGGGVVGKATARTYLEFAEEVRVYDQDPTRRTVDLWNLPLQCDIVFVCLPETALDGYFGSPGIQELGRDVNFVLKSTVPVGTTRRLAETYKLPNLVHSPEFLTARCAEADARLPARNIVGLVKRDAPWLINLYRQRFPGIPVLAMTSDESEAVKLMTNAYYAVKVAFFNEARTLADARGLDWERVRAGVLSGGVIGEHHTRVPGPDGQRGFGGACLVKDLEHFIKAFQDDIPPESAPKLRTDKPPLLAAAALSRNTWDRPRAR